LWQADVAALGRERRADLSVTPEQARSVEAVLDRLVRAGSPRLRAAIDAERRSNPPGLSFAEAVLQELAR
jgi:hypothetical protein